MFFLLALGDFFDEKKHKYAGWEMKHTGWISYDVA